MTVPLPTKPKGLLKWVLTLPLSLYRWHLGWLVDHRDLVVTHLGQKTGRRRQTEVVHDDPATQECCVVTGCWTLKNNPNKGKESGCLLFSGR